MNEPRDRNLSVYADLMSMAQGYRASRILLTDVELGIFETIDGEILSAADIAARIGTDRRATEILLEASAGVGLLEKRADGYRNAPAVTDLLRKNGADSLLHHFRHLNNCWQRWSSLTEVVRKGYPEKGTHSRAESIDLAMAMRVGSKETAERLGLMLDFSKMHHLCDMGCGPGAICMELLQMHPHLSAVLIDYDEDAVNIARSDAASRGLQNRVEIIHQDILSVGIEKKFDMILLSLVLCLFAREDAIRLLQKAQAALLPGGVLILGETLLNSSRPGSAPAAVFAAHLLVMGSRGSLYSLDDIRELLHHSGMRYERNFPSNLYHIIVGKNEPC